MHIYNPDCLRKKTKSYMVISKRGDCNEKREKDRLQKKS